MAPHSTYPLGRLASFTQHSAFVILPSYCHHQQVIAFYYWVVFHWMYIPQCLYSFTDWRIWTLVWAGMRVYQSNATFALSMQLRQDTHCWENRCWLGSVFIPCFWEYCFSSLGANKVWLCRILMPSSILFVPQITNIPSRCSNGKWYEYLSWPPDLYNSFTFLFMYLRDRHGSAGSPFKCLPWPGLDQDNPSSVRVTGTQLLC